MTNTERKILTEMQMNGPVTYLVCEAIDVPLASFLDCMGGLVRKGWVTNRYVEVKSTGGRDKMLLQYSLTGRFKTMYQFKL